jgi:16S rRNA (guanine(966)-N(2))-methyltransferase RsmD
LRPLADRAREALFSILGDAVPDRPFYDIFAGSGAVGLEALSRGASSVVFVEREPRAVAELVQALETFGVSGRARVLRADAYRWADKWPPAAEPVNLFLGPPYREFDQHFDAIVWLVHCLQQKSAPSSVLVVQADKKFDAQQLPKPQHWDVRAYGRTQLAIWIKEESGIGEQELGIRNQEEWKDGRMEG